MSMWFSKKNFKILWKT